VVQACHHCAALCRIDDLLLLLCATRQYQMPDLCMPFARLLTANMQQSLCQLRPGMDPVQFVIHSQLIFGGAYSTESLSRPCTVCFELLITE